MEKQRRLRYATNLAHKLTENKHKDDNMQTPAHTHTDTHCVSVAALIIYSRPTLLTLPGKQTTERRKQEGRKGRERMIIEEENQRVKMRRVVENEGCISLVFSHLGSVILMEGNQKKRPLCSWRAEPPAAAAARPLYVTTAHRSECTTFSRSYTCMLIDCLLAWDRYLAVVLLHQSDI